MPDSKKITIKTKVSINTISDDVDARNQSHSSSDANRSILNDEQNGIQRQSSKRHSSRRKKASSDNGIETISLEESINVRQAVPSLKASFLRRKMKEYEGKKIQLSCLTCLVTGIKYY